MALILLLTVSLLRRGGREGEGGCSKVQGGAEREREAQSRGRGVGGGGGGHGAWWIWLSIYIMGVKLLYF